MNSIRWKLVIMYIAIVFIVMIISGTFIIVSVRNSEYDTAKKELKSEAADIIKENIIDEYESSSDFPKAFEEMTRVPPNQDWVILDGVSGRTLYTSQISDSLLLPQYSSSVIISAKVGEESFSENREYPNSNGQPKKWMELAVPVNIDKNGNPEDSSKPQYIIYVRMNADRINTSIEQIIRVIALAIVLAIVLSGIFGVLFASTLTDPIRILTSKAKELARGNLNQRIETDSKDEIGQLTESFNDMAKELGTTLEGMENEKNKMEIVLYNMTDGVLAYDNNGTLIHINQVAQELLNVTDIGKISLEQMLTAVLPEAEHFSIKDLDNFREVTLAISDKYIEAIFSPYKNKEGNLEGVVIVLQDITKHKKLDNMRKEFVANVSHEIRTPLTTIKSYTETLMDGAIKDNDTAVDFLDVINSETDRMTLIVRDLLELSSIDNDQIVLDIQEVDLVGIVNHTIKNHALAAKKDDKKIVFENNLETMIIKADSARISQVISNILSNAIKYSSHGSQIKIDSQEGDDCYKIYIKDNGFGIPKEDLRRIFERFYRVDKARSRAMGGTGLGLPIAKEIMLAHGGKISASSELGKGTTIILRFPKIKDK